MKKSLSLILSFLMIVSLFSGCATKSSGQSGAYGLVDSSQSTDLSGAPEEIILSGKTAKYSKPDVTINGNVITISHEGEYYFTGKLDDGQIVINTGETAGSVYIYLDNADITCLTAPAIYVLQAKKVHIVLLKGTENRIVSGTEADLAAFDGTANGGAVFAEDDVDIEGEGSLQVFGYINNGITCKDDVRIEGGNLTVFAANNGIKASESFTAIAGNVNITCSNDGIKTTSSAKDGKGFISIEGGTFVMSVGGDGISAETDLTVSGGSISVNSSGERILGSCKGLKAKNGLVISGGSIVVSCDDHALHAGGGMLISGGILDLTSTAAKGLDANEKIELTGGSIDICSAGDGIETKGDVEIIGASVNIVSEADGIKCGEKGDGFTPNTGVVSISGGNINISAALDPIDAKLSSEISGGSLCAAGSPEKIKVFSSASVPYIACFFSGTADDPLTVSDPGNNEICSCSFSKDYSVVVIAVPELVTGTAYSLSVTDKTASAEAK